MKTVYKSRRVFALGFLAFACLASRCSSSSSLSPTATGIEALRLTRELVALGPRPPGSAGIEKVRQWVESEAKKMGLQVQRDRFVARTPIGDIDMQNLSLRISGTSSSREVWLVAHYDSKRMLGFDFVGANDAASSVALLLALVPEIRLAALPFDVILQFVDGEEALERWSDADSLYGSRRLASQANSSHVMAAVILDMIGDASLQLVDDVKCDARFRSLLKEILSELELKGLLESEPVSIQDDHVPLIEAGLPTMYLMDFTYGGSTSPGKFWHTKDDTVDHLSDSSLSIVGEILLRALKKIPSTLLLPR